LRNAGFKLSLAILAGYAVYALWPGLDLAVTRLFFDGNGFPVQQMRGVEAVRMALYIAEDVVPFVALGLAFAARRGVLGLGRRDWVYAFSLFVTGPGLMANVITKPIWGRARPRAIVEFGGTLEYTQPWQFSDQCRAGCSFVSGEMAGATALALVLGMVLLANRAAMGPVARGLGLHRRHPGLYRLAAHCGGAAFSVGCRVRRLVYAGFGQPAAVGLPPPAFAKRC
jgi:hypothetical protein